MTSEVAVPVNKPVIAYISSMDVIHSFKVIPMRINQDATPGMIVPVHFVPNRVGSYPINCAQLCGVGHSIMRGVLHVMEQANYDEWLASKRGQATAADYE